jgi:hypothetical protein
MGEWRVPMTSRTARSASSRARTVSKTWFGVDINEAGFDAEGENGRAFGSLLGMAFALRVTPRARDASEEGDVRDDARRMSSTIEMTARRAQPFEQGPHQSTAGEGRS